MATVRRLFSAALLALLAAVAEPGAALADTVAEKTVIRDPQLPEIKLFQDPGAMTNIFPRDRETRPDWVDILRRGLIQPRETLRGGPRPPEPMGEPPQHGLLFKNTKQMPNVLFPHQPHAEWLACSNCHDGLFPRQSTGQGPGMQAILDGKFCGACHGRVAFSPEGSCYRCHSQPNTGMLIESPPADGAKALEDLEATPEEEGGDRPRRRRTGAQTVTPRGRGRMN